MLLRQIETYCAVCRTGSFTRAAEEAFISQSAVSQQIRALEAALEVQLIERHGRSFSLTPAGEYFYRHANDLLQRLEELRFETQGIAGGYATRLSLGYLNRYEGWEVQAAVAAFTARHPRIAVHAQAGSHDELYHLLTTGQIDLAFNDRWRELDAAYVNQPLLTSYRYVELSEVNPLAAAEGLHTSDLRGETCILIAGPDTEAAERTHYRDVLNFDCEFLFARSREEGRMMVAGNRGFMPVELRSDTGAEGRVIKRVPLLAPDLTHLRHEYYAFHPKAKANPLAQEFAEILKDLFNA